MAPKSALAALVALPALAMGAAIDARSQGIVGGTTAASGEFPYLVSLSYGGSHFCGGVLLNANTVLTAGHCTVDMNARDVKVRAGSLNWASGGVQVNVSNIMLNPEYTVDSQGVPDWDTGVWRLASPIQQSSTIGYATLAAPNTDVAAGSTITVAGWGTTSENSNSLPSAARKVSVPVISRSSCNSEYDGEVTNNMFCAGLPQGGKDSCSGDSGGPVIDSTGTVVGVVSWGQGCAEAGFAGVYSRIATMRDFIDYV